MCSSDLNNVFELVHTGVGEHQRGVILDDHGCRRNDVVALGAEKLLERLAYFLCSEHDLGYYVYVLIFPYLISRVQNY